MIFNRKHTDFDYFFGTFHIWRQLLFYRKWQKEKSHLLDKFYTLLACNVERKMVGEILKNMVQHPLPVIPAQRRVIYWIRVGGGVEFQVQRPLLESFHLL